MAVYTPVPAEALARFLDLYDVGELVSAKGIAEGVENTNYLVDTTRGRYILTLYERRVAADDLPFFVALLDHLAARGLPVPPAIRGRDGTAIRTLEGRPACLIRFLLGVSLSAPTPADAHQAGAALAALHRAAADFPRPRANTMGLAAWPALYARVGSDLDRIAPGLHADVGTVLAAVAADWPADLPAGIIHADLFPDNVLSLGGRITGLIDFYFACTDLHLYDLAITHAAWSFDAEGRIHDRAIGDAMIAGYTGGGPLADEQRRPFATLAAGACLRFTLSRAWDWRNTPADALVTRKDPLGFWRRLRTYRPDLAAALSTGA